MTDNRRQKQAVAGPADPPIESGLITLTQQILIDLGKWPT